MAVEGVRRPAWAEVSASAIRHNVRALRAVVGDAAICAVVKANGYGHGPLLVANAALEGGATSLAVALVDEGLELRHAGISAPILLLTEIPPETIPDAYGADLTLTIGSLDGARAASRWAQSLGALAPVHVKVDTGMHRMGVVPEDLDEVVDVVMASANLELEGLYTHLSVADGPSVEDRAFSESQIQLFDDLVAGLAARGVAPAILHCANSAGALGYPSSRYTMVRVGLSLYGYLPHEWLASALEEKGEHLTPALAFGPGLGRSPDIGGRAAELWTLRALTRDATIVTVPFGYADGYPRHLFEGGAHVLINGQRYPLAGMVTMDQLVVDVGDGDVAVGDDVVLLGRQGSDVVSAEEWARWGGTITWEVLTSLGARVPRVLVD